MKGLISTSIQSQDRLNDQGEDLVEINLTAECEEAHNIFVSVNLPAKLRQTLFYPL